MHNSHNRRPRAFWGDVAPMRHREVRLYLRDGHYGARFDVTGYISDSAVLLLSRRAAGAACELQKSWARLEVLLNRPLN